MRYCKLLYKVGCAGDLIQSHLTELRLIAKLVSVKAIKYTITVPVIAYTPETFQFKDEWKVPGPVSIVRGDLCISSDEEVDIVPPPKRSNKSKHPNKL